MEIYTTSKFANYAHIHMYIVDLAFRNKLIAHNLTDYNYNFNVNIDGNVAVWSLSADNKDITDCFADVIKELSFDEKNIKEAVKRIEDKNNSKSDIKDINLLISELSKIKFTYDKPKITDDNLKSPAVDFAKRD